MPFPTNPNPPVQTKPISPCIASILAVASLALVSCTAPPPADRTAQIKKDIGIRAWYDSKDGQAFLKRLQCKDDLEFIYEHRTEVHPLGDSNANERGSQHLIQVDYDFRSIFVASWNDGGIVRFSNSLGPFESPSATIVGHTPDGCLIEIVYKSGWGTDYYEHTRLLVLFMKGALHTVYDGDARGYLGLDLQYECQVTWLTKDFSEFQVLYVAHLDKTEVHRSQDVYRWYPPKNQYYRAIIGSDGTFNGSVSKWDLWLAEDRQPTIPDESPGQTPAATDNPHQK